MSIYSERYAKSLVILESLKFNLKQIKKVLEDSDEDTLRFSEMIDSDIFELENRLKKKLKAAQKSDQIQLDELMRKI